MGRENLSSGGQLALAQNQAVVQDPRYLAVRRVDLEIPHHTSPWIAHERWGEDRLGGLLSQPADQFAFQLVTNWDRDLNHKHPLMGDQPELCRIADLWVTWMGDWAQVPGCALGRPTET